MANQPKMVPMDLYLLVTPRWMLDRLMNVFGPYADRDGHCRIITQMIALASSAHDDLGWMGVPAVVRAHALLHADGGGLEVRLSAGELLGMLDWWRMAVPRAKGKGRGRPGFMKEKDRMALAAVVEALRAFVKGVGKIRWARSFDVSRRIVTTEARP